MHPLTGAIFGEAIATVGTVSMAMAVASRKADGKMTRTRMQVITHVVSQGPHYLHVISFSVFKFCILSFFLSFINICTFAVARPTRYQ